MRFLRGRSSLPILVRLPPLYALAVAPVPARSVDQPPKTGVNVPASTILVVDTDAASAELMNTGLTGVGYTVTVVGTAADAFRLAAENQLVIIDVVEGESGPADVCREIRATPSMASVPVLCISQSDDVEDRIRFLQAGADDVMAKPFDARELEARVEALLVRFRRSKDLAPMQAVDPTVRPVRRMVTVFSPKGGVGTTTIAVNVAVTVAERRPERTLLIDFSRQFGQAGDVPMQQYSGQYNN